jgi:phosphatidylinositol-3-phosphatase
MKNIFVLFITICLVLCGCAKPGEADKDKNENAFPTPSRNPGTMNDGVPVFEHIIIIWMENEDYDTIAGSRQMPVLNDLAKQNVLLSNYYAIAHPSLPNYLALISGSTFGITKDCTDCYFKDTSLPDLLDRAKISWKTYQEDMPSPCFIGNKNPYYQKHNPFVYFDSVRNDQKRCQAGVVPLSQMANDLSSGKFPNFAFVMPNICNSGHNCSLKTADQWLKNTVDMFHDAESLGNNTLIVIGFDEGGDKNLDGCCGLKSGGGKVFTVLLSPLAKPAFTDETPLNHYSLLKTILISWSLPDLGFSSNPETQPITAPWK